MVASNMKRKRKITNLGDIAELAGVSKATASRALRNSPLVNESTREKVRAVAQKHSFRVDTRARNLRLQRTHAIAAIMHLDPDSGQALSDPFLLDLIGSIANELAEQDYDLLLSTSRSFDADQSAGYVETKKADGLIIIGQGKDYMEINTMTDRGAPVVVWGAKVADQPYCTVGSDNFRGGYLATDHLLSCGRKRIVFLGDALHPEIQQRYAGYERALRDQGIPIEETLKVSAAFSSESGFVQTAKLLKDDISFDAMFCVSDSIALGALKALKEHNVDVPARVAVIGFDDSPAASYSHPALSTVRQNTKLGGKILAEKILRIIHNERPESAILETSLVVRESTSLAPE